MPHLALSETQTQTLWRIASGVPLRETIDELAHALQAVSPGLRVAVLIAERDPDGDTPPFLRFGGAPSMGDSYRASVDGMPLTPGASSSADVVLTNRALFIQSGDDARVPETMRDFYRRFGIKAAYLAPLKNPQTPDIIGVFCLYPNHFGAPSPEETTLLTLGASLAALAISRDNAERARKRSEETLAQLMQGLRLQASTDALTGLPNRAQFLETLTHTLDEARRTGGIAVSPAVLFVDLDRFKMVNDTLGHAAGDHLLGEMATRLGQCVTTQDTVARIGGDEFVVLLARADAQIARKTARQLRSVATKPVIVGEQEAFVGASVGIALWTSDETVTAEALLKNADTAMYYAKQEGGNGYALYTLAMGDAMLDRAMMEADLRRALTRGELFLAFQPQFDLITKRMIGVEALVRWNHPRRGSVAPADFIPIAEDSGLIEPLGEWVLREACQRGAYWQTLPRPLRIAVNLSPRQFSPRNNIALQVGRVLSETGFDPALLDLEITESVLLSKTVPVLDTLTAIKALGVRLLLDDFGTGYGSLLYLRQFPLDVLKVDSSFVHGLSQSREDAAIVRAVIDLAHALGMRVVAEGVETEDQLAELALLGCDALQGFLFSRPLPPEEIERLLREPEAGSER